MVNHTTKLQQHKIDSVEAIKKNLGEAHDFVFADYRGLTVSQITELRSRLRERNAELRVVKNNHAKLAFQQMQLPDVSEYFVGPTAVAIARTDSAPVVKALFDFGREGPVTVKGSLISGVVFDASQTEAYSKLPSRDELIAKLMGTMQAPLQNFVYVLNGVTTKLARTLQAVADKKAQSGE